MKRLNSGAVSLMEEDSDQSSNSTDYGLQHAEEMLRDKDHVANDSELSVDETNSINSRSEEQLFDNQSLHEMPQVSEATEGDSSEDVIMGESEQEVKGELKVSPKGNNDQRMKRKT